MFKKMLISDSNHMAKTDNKSYFEKLLCLLQCFFFRRTNGGKMERTSRQTQCPVSKILQRYINELKLTVLLVLTE